MILFALVYTNVVDMHEINRIPKESICGKNPQLNQLYDELDKSTSFPDDFERMFKPAYTAQQAKLKALIPENFALPTPVFDQERLYLHCLMKVGLKLAQKHGWSVEHEAVPQDAYWKQFLTETRGELHNYLCEFMLKDMRKVMEENQAAQWAQDKKEIERVLDLVPYSDYRQATRSITVIKDAVCSAQTPRGAQTPVEQPPAEQPKPKRSILKRLFK